jgi:hypothetical protein
MTDQSSLASANASFGLLLTYFLLKLRRYILVFLKKASEAKQQSSKEILKTFFVV